MVFSLSLLFSQDDIPQEHTENVIHEHTRL